MEKYHTATQQYREARYMAMLGLKPDARKGSAAITLLHVYDKMPLCCDAPHGHRKGA